MSTTSASASNKSLSELYCKYLRTIKDNWSSCHAARLLNPNLLEYLLPRFQNCSTPLKVRILTSFLFISSELREGCKVILHRILRIGEVGTDEWVRKLSRILIPYISTGCIDLKETDTETVFRIISFLDEQRSLSISDDPDSPGEYRVKSGLEYVHLCSPYSCDDESQNNEVYEYELFTPTGNFGELLNDVVEKGLNQMLAEVKTKKYDDKTMGVRFSTTNIRRNL